MATREASDALLASLDTSSQSLAALPEGAKPAQTAYRSLWQNPVAERWIGSCRRELLDHVVVLGERHLVRLIRFYLEYYHGDRPHLGLAKDAPDRRPVTPRPSLTAKVVSFPRIGGLYHRYEWRVAPLTF